MVQKEFTVRQGSNGAAIEVSNQTRVNVYDADGNLVFSDSSNTNEVYPSLAPGRYIVETDGRLKSVRSSTKGELDVD